MAVWHVHQGDCREIALSLAARGVRFDAIVTDPPYHLQTAHRFAKTSLDDNNITGEKARNRTTPQSRLSRGFMGMSWDGGDIAFQAQTWRNLYALLKPGAHIAAFGGSRTAHRVACAIEDAGFEIRDSIYWIYGQGFPKSLDVSKAIDKKAGAKRKIIGVRSQPDIRGDSYVNRARHDKTGNVEVLDTEPATSEAKQWDGWGTALKPAVEPIILARKPLDGSVVNTVLKYGTGALNIGACGVETNGRPHVVIDPKKHIVGTVFAARRSNNATGFDGGSKFVGTTTNERWPANLIHDGSDVVEAEFAKFGNHPGMKSALLRRGITTGRGMGYLSTSVGEDTITGYDDDGSPARFFKEASWTTDEVMFYTSKATEADRAWSDHPTVKPLDLMHWLVRLITPPGGTVLDPFAGTGTTLQAAVEQGFNAVGCEVTPKYIGDIERRMATFCALYDRRDPFVRERRQLRG